MNLNPEIIGFIAGSLTTFSLVPQVIKIIKTKHTKDLSLAMYLLFTLGISLWLVYGVIADLPSLIITNSITIILAGIILYYKIIEEKSS